jgi:hypothetical protein
VTKNLWLAGWLAATLMPTSALADTFTVTGLGDTCAVPSAINLCTNVGAGQWTCTELRHAFNDINLGTGTAPHVIELPAGTITLSPGLPVPAENANECGDMDLLAPVGLTMNGHPSGTVIDADGFRTRDRAFDLRAGSVSLDGFTITDGFAMLGLPGDPAYPNHGGGGIRSFAMLTLRDMIITTNRAESIYTSDPGGGGVYVTAQVDVVDTFITENVVIEGVGGGIHAVGGASIQDSAIRQNLASAGGWGGGVALSGGAGSTLTRTTISANSASALGGGMVVFGPGTSVDVVESVIDNNLLNWNAPMCTTCKAGGGGLAVHQGGIVDLFNSTISTNNVNPVVDPSAPTPAGGAIWVTNPAATVTLDYVTISQNTVTPSSGTAFPNGLECDGTCTVGDSIAEDTCFTGGTLTWGITSIDAAGGSCSGGPSVAPFLLPLALSGGSPTRTHAHLPVSPADNAANPATCPAIDQRGVNRNPSCDVGAHEVP